MFVKQLTPSLNSQLEEMCQSDEASCNAQDIVSHVSYKILSSLLHQPFTRQLNLNVSNKELISVEVRSLFDSILVPNSVAQSVIRLCIHGPSLRQNCLSKITQ